ncbi:putative toxin-antitoxin system toxin component, PIN family [Capnocytophaga leadbetteri]|uniref:putative toxin-antitoxin system toxin component, PIN family n=1 Tax=Capnocytophaga leadbetteri TaxID=327575 RepID=UPI0028D02A65|nr:putative toxin-antitoxin system toxin component, PIN family [Capnocytophaga leadbetteri]
MDSLSYKQRFFSLQSVYDLLEIIQRKAIFVEVISEIAVCRDYKDNFLLALAKDAKADFILTGDNDLLVLNPFEETSIITINTFLSIYG